MRKLLINIFLLFTGSGMSIAQDVSISAAFDSSRIFIGDQINFTITVEQPDGISLTLPSFKDTLVKNIDILRGPDTDSIISNGRIRITEKYIITSFDSGLYKIDPVFAEVKTGEGFQRFLSDYAMLEVLKYKVAPSDSTARIYDIIEPYKAPLTAREIIPLILIAALAGALVWAAIFFLKKYKKTSTGEEEIIVPDPAHVIAFRDLGKLRDEELWQKGHYKEYYTRLTEILRQYLENRFQVYSLELTTSETLEALLKTGFRNETEYARLKEVLTAADLVKFAKHRPVIEENTVHFSNAWEFVDATKEHEVARQPEKDEKREVEA